MSEAGARTHVVDPPRTRRPGRSSVRRRPRRRGARSRARHPGLRPRPDARAGAGARAASRRSTAPGWMAACGWRSRPNTNPSVLRFVRGLGEPGTPGERRHGRVLAARGGVGDRARLARGRDQLHRHEPLGARPRRDPRPSRASISTSTSCRRSIASDAARPAARSGSASTRAPAPGFAGGGHTLYSGAAADEVRHLPRAARRRACDRAPHDLTIDTVHFHVGRRLPERRARRISTRSCGAWRRWCGRCRRRGVRSPR